MDYSLSEKGVGAVTVNTVNGTALTRRDTADCSVVCWYTRPLGDIKIMRFALDGSLWVVTACRELCHADRRAVPTGPKPNRLVPKM